MDTFKLIQEIIRITQITKLDYGKVQLVVTDGNTYETPEHDTTTEEHTVSTENFKDKIVIDVISLLGTDSDVISYCNSVTDVLGAYGVLDRVVVQPSCENPETVSTMDDYLRNYHYSGISLQWVDGSVVVSTCSEYRSA